MSTEKEQLPHRTQWDINNEMMCRLRAVSHNAAVHEMVPVDNCELAMLIHAANKVINVPAISREELRGKYCRNWLSRSRTP